ncbi:MAG TPA: hypothetical protein VG188_06690 [Solirubrobacteraceae bacterium]|jgi:hypothetical protein|nr:hypothetical protein [Solirubrobacteraceae bacterium]
MAERRAQLRILDIALCAELEDAGALTFQSLREQVSARNLLHAPVSDESLWEWWHYAKRRRIVEPGLDPDEMSLSDRGRARLEEVQRTAAAPSAPKARAVVRYLIPPGLAGALVAGALGVLNKSRALALGAIAIIAVALIYWFLAELIDFLFAKRIDPRVERAWLKRTVAWLDGDQVRWLGWTRHDAADKAAMKRLHTPALPSDAGRPPVM